MLGRSLFIFAAFVIVVLAGRWEGVTTTASDPSSGNAAQPVSQVQATDTPASLPTDPNTIAETEPELPTAEPLLLTPVPQATHIVLPGETLYRIALDHGVSMDLLADVNGIRDVTVIYTGQRLIIPVGNVAPPTSTIPPTPAPPQEVVSIIEDTPAEVLVEEQAPIETATELPVEMPTDVPTEVPTEVLMAAPTEITEEQVPAEETEIVLPPPATELNSVSIQEIIVMPDEVIANVREIYARGQELGRNPQSFSKLGDSTIENPFFLTRFDDGVYNLADYAYLQPVIDYYQGSFGRQGIAVMRGLHSWSIFDPFFAPRSTCEPNEPIVDCEFRLNNPSILFVRLGTNDVGVTGSFDHNLRRLVEHSMELGIIPIMGTKADRFGDPNNVNNDIIRKIAQDYQVPLWDFDLIAGTIPGRGLDVDGVHLNTFYAHDYSSPTALQRGHGVHNLTALMALNAVWQAVGAN